MRQVTEENMVNLSKLVRLAQAGDIAGYEQLIKRFQASAFSQAFSLLCDSYVAEDAVQDAFVEAFRRLHSLRTPEAFASWFHRVVFTSCNRITRRRAVPTSSLEEAERKIADPAESPAERLERKQRDQSVHLAIQSLPDSLRMVTALYYIGGISQREIADYLNLTEASVKKRLFDARRKLREDITNMAQRISEGKIPTEQISARVIAELVSRPQPLLVKDNPLTQVFELAKKALPDYRVIEGHEVEENKIYASIQESFFSGGPAYQLDSSHVLRTQTTGATFRAIKGGSPPVRLLTAGRVFRPVPEDKFHLKVFNQLDGICVSRDASINELTDTVKSLIMSVLGQVEVRFRKADYGFIDHGADVDVKDRGKWIGVSGCGTLKPEMLKEAGYNPKQVQGFAFGMGLERIAVIKFGLKSVDELWRPPYLTPGL